MFKKVRKYLNNEKGFTEIVVVLILVVIASYLSFTYFVGNGDGDDQAVMPVIKGTAIEATSSLSILNDKIKEGLK